jgi:hypothetical protein
LAAASDGMHGVGEANLGDLRTAAHHCRGLPRTRGNVDRFRLEAFLLIEPSADGDVLQQERHALAGEGDRDLLQVLGCCRAKHKKAKRQRCQTNAAKPHRASSQIFFGIRVVQPCSGRHATANVAADATSNHGRAA